MKLLKSFLAILITCLLLSAKNKGEVVISGKILGPIPEKVDYTIPQNGICDWMTTESVKPDLNGIFRIIVSPDKMSFIKLHVSSKLQGILIIEPGKSYDVVFDLNKGKENFQVFGETEIAQNQYNKLPNPVHIQIGAREFIKDSVASSIKERVAIKKGKEIVIFQELYNNRGISREFLEMVQMDRECYYAAVTATAVWIKQMISAQNKKGKFPDEMKALWEETFRQPLLMKENLIRSPWCYSYAESYIYFKEYMNNDLDDGKLLEIRKNNRYKTFQISEAQKYLSDKVLESFTAIYIYIVSSQKDYENELITLYNQFIKDYPRSLYTKYLTPLINENIKFHKIAESEFSEKIKFVDGSQNFNDLKDAVKSFKGTRIFIDVWATWCGPCKAEFEHKEELNRLLTSKGIKMLYISIDKEEKEKQWKDMIKFYNLSGNHIRANDRLITDLRKIFDQNGSISIPWYIQLDENGDILIKHARQPSDLKGLEKELNALK